MARVGWYCDHGDEPTGHGSHQEWKLVRGKWVTRENPNVGRALTFGEGWPTQTKPPCPKAVPVYTKERRGR